MRVNLEQFETIEEAPSSREDKYFEGWLNIEEGDWTQDHKYQIQECIVYNVPTDKYYRYTLSRSGSPFSDWEYSHRYDGYVDLEEVVKKERVVTITEWAPV